MIAETREWRKICDPEGSVAWVHRSVVSARRGAFNASLEEVPVRSGRSEEAGLRAREDVFASFLARRLPLCAPREAARRRFLERLSTARQTRIRYEVIMQVEGLFALRGLHTR